MEPGTRPPFAEGMPRGAGGFGARRIAAGWLMLACLMESLPTVARAQTCWRGQPAPACHLSIISEAGPRLGTQEAWDPLGYVVALGLTVNDRPGSIGIGGAVELSSAEEEGVYHVVIMPRVRWWVSQVLAVDAGMGISIVTPGGSLMVGLNYQDLVVLTAGVNSGSVGVGIRFASFLAPAGLLASIALGAAAAGG